MAENILNGRIQMKTDTCANWARARNFIPRKGEVLVYSDYSSTTDSSGNTVYIPNFKIGDGLAYGIDLPFVNDDLRIQLTDHIADQNIHINPAERAE